MNEIDVRQSLLRFPAFTQPFWTWLTGKPLPGEHPLYRWGPWGYLGRTLLTFAGGIALTSYAVLRLPPALPLWIIAGWALTLNGARHMALVLVHQCGHFRFTGNARVDRVVGELLSTLLCSQDVVSYRHDHHVLHHGNRTFTTDRDPVLIFICQFGFRQGMSRRQLWLHTAKTMVSPYFHGYYLFSRLRSNLVRAPGLRRIAAWAYLGAWAALALLVDGMGIVWLVAFAVPLFFFYHQSAFLELLTEHAWFIPRRAEETAREHIAGRCWGRFCANQLPDPHLPPLARIGAWTWWTLVTLLVHLPVRLLVLVGDAPQHDYHHRHPGSLEWPNPAYARQADIDEGHPGWPKYWDVWGLHVAMNHVFDALARHPRTSEPLVDGRGGSLAADGPPR